MKLDRGNRMGRLQAPMVQHAQQLSGQRPRDPHQLELARDACMLYIQFDAKSVAHAPIRMQERKAHARPSVIAINSLTSRFNQSKANLKALRCGFKAAM